MKLLSAAIPRALIAIDSAPSMTNQNTTRPITREGDVSGATRRMYSPLAPERRALSAPIFSRASATTFCSTFATRNPISRMIRNPISLGRKPIRSFSPPWRLFDISTAAITGFLLYSANDLAGRLHPGRARLHLAHLLGYLMYLRPVPHLVSPP